METKKIAEISQLQDAEEGNDWEELLIAWRRTFLDFFSILSLSHRNGMR